MKEMGMKEKIKQFWRRKTGQVNWLGIGGKITPKQSFQVLRFEKWWNPLRVTAKSRREFSFSDMISFVLSGLGLQSLRDAWLLGS